jgi:hypothetical protein
MKQYPSREGNLLSEHIFHIFGRTLTITTQEQFFAVAILAIGFTAWIVLQFRRRRVVVVHRSGVSDQLLYDLSRKTEPFPIPCLGESGPIAS